MTRPTLTLLALLAAVSSLSCGEPAAGGHCTNVQRDDDETDVDCGGAACAACANGKRCRVPDDCESALCVGLRCVAPGGCSNGARDGQESDVDCGGACPSCADGKACGSDGDCASRRCTNGVCQPPAPGCLDGQKNGSETDIDCGGGQCPTCADGRACLAPGDCASNSCNGGVCGPADDCHNQMKDNDETDVDCGGAKCAPCPDGAACLAPRDCVAMACTNAKCGKPARLMLSFGPATPYVGVDIRSHRGVLLGDFDGDKKLDAAMLGEILVVYLGKGDGTLVAGVATPLPDRASGHMVAADFNGDGRTDIAVAGSQTPANILLGSQGGMFQVGTPLEKSGLTYAAGDLNGDKKPDIVADSFVDRETVVWNGKGDGTFTRGATLAINGGYDGVIADFNRDGKLDFLLAAGAFYTFLNDGQGGYKPAVTTVVASPFYLTPGDFNGDGIPDLVHRASSSPTYVVLSVGKGDGSFAGVTTIGRDPGNLPLVADFDRDGQLDVITLYNNNLRPFLGDGKGGFVEQPVIVSPGLSPFGGAGDLNGDGKPDLVFDAGGGASAMVLLNTSK